MTKTIKNYIYLIIYFKYNILKTDDGVQCTNET